VLSGRGLCDELITRPEEPYLLWRVVLCDLETSKEEAKSLLMGCEYKPIMGCDAERKKNAPSRKRSVIEYNKRLLFITLRTTVLSRSVSVD